MASGTGRDRPGDVGLPALGSRGTGSYADAFRRLASAGKIDAPLADRLARAAGFRHAIAHAYDRLDMARVHRTALEGPRDLEACLGALRDRL